MFLQARSLVDHAEGRPSLLGASFVVLDVNDFDDFKKEHVITGEYFIAFVGEATVIR